MYKNKSISGRNNICGIKIRELRSRMNDVSQKRLADMLQLLGLDLDKNAIQRIESGKRFVTDIELRYFAKVLNVSYEELLSEDTPEPHAAFLRKSHLCPGPDRQSRKEGCHRRYGGKRHFRPHGPEAFPTEP